ncbi:MAG: iron ABC transporter permease [Acidimicrobiia bacterium]|nr:iron ABC transporter permease [Acidimicrobiia bacterium]
MGLPLAFFGYFFAYPVGRILYRGLADATIIDGFGGVVWFTLWQAVVSTVLTLVVALPGTYVASRFEFRGRAFFRAAVTVPFMLPTLVVAMAFLALFGPGGATGLRLDGTAAIIIAAHVFFNYAVVVRIVGGLWQHLDPTLGDAARALSASPWQAFRRVTLPLLAPALAAASSIVFLFSFTSFGVVLLLGGPGLATIEVEIYRQTTAFLNLGAAATLALVQLVGVTAILFAYSRFQEHTAHRMRLAPGTSTARVPTTPGERWLVRLTLASAAVLLGGPLVVLVTKSLRPGGEWSLSGYAELFETPRALAVPPAEAVANSLLFAGVTVLIAVVIGLSAASVIASRRLAWFDVLLMLPLGTSAVTVGLGFLVALDWPIDLRTSPVLIPIAHSLVAIPFVVRAAVPVLRSVDQRLREAAANLGAPPAQVWRTVDLPLVSRAALLGAGLAAAVSLGEFGATAFIARPDYPTVPIAIFRLLAIPGSSNLAAAFALSTVLMALTTVVIAALEKARPGVIGGF